MWWALIDRVSNLKYESVHIDSKTVVFIRANPGKKETTDGSGSHVNFIQKLGVGGWGRPPGSAALGYTWR